MRVVKDDVSGERFGVFGKSVYPLGEKAGKQNRAEAKERRVLDGEIAKFKRKVATVQTQLRNPDLNTLRRIEKEKNRDMLQQELNGLRAYRESVFGDDPEDTPPAADAAAPDFSKRNETEAPYSFKTAREKFLQGLTSF